MQRTAPSIQPREREMNLVTVDHKVPQGFAHAASTLSSELERENKLRIRKKERDKEGERKRKIRKEKETKEV